MVNQNTPQLVLFNILLFSISALVDCGVFAGHLLSLQLRTTSTLHTFSLHQQNGRVEQLVLGHEPLLPRQAVPVQGPQQGTSPSPICRFQRTQNVDKPRDNGAKLVHENWLASGSKVKIDNNNFTKLFGDNLDTQLKYFNLRLYIFKTFGN